MAKERGAESMDNIKPGIFFDNAPRHGPGPSDVEWALLLQEFNTMKKVLAELVEEVKKFGRDSAAKCESCANSATIKDHEMRLRNVEQTIWKAMGVAAVVASFMSFFLGKFFK